MYHKCVWGGACGVIGIGVGRCVPRDMNTLLRTMTSWDGMCFSCGNLYMQDNTPHHRAGHQALPVIGVKVQWRCFLTLREG